LITVALDKDAEAARPWIEAAAPQHPSLIDIHHVVADLYGMVNVPTTVWIDEGGKIVRPNDVVFATDTYLKITGLESAKPLAAIRAWVRDETQPMAPAEVRRHQRLPTAARQEARAEFGLARWLCEQGRGAEAEPHFLRAGELAPEDWTIRRGSLPLRGLDSMGPPFRTMREEWARQGNAYYLPIPD